MSADPLQDLADSVAPPKWPSGAAKGVVKIRYTHDAMIDQILANPCISQNQLAIHFGYTAGWVSQIISSDAFQSRLAERSKEIVDPILQVSVKAQFEGLISRSLEILRHKLDKPPDQIPDNLALRSADLAAKALGYGARVEQTNVQINMGDHLDKLGENLTRLLERKKAEAGGTTIEGELT